MRMQASPVVETDEQMLPDALHAQHGEPREIMLGEPWMAQFPRVRRFLLSAAAMCFAAK